ncbi:unnamed protein product [Cutaneotrichosporon oleaginosum]
MASRILLRGLHTTRAALDAAGASAGAEGAAKTSLGFTAQPKRTRTLPALQIPKSSYQNLPGAAGRERRAERATGPRTDAARTDRPRGDRAGASRGDRPSVARADRAAPRADRAQQPRTNLSAVSSEFFEGAELARKFTRPDAPRRAAPRKPRESKGRGVPVAGDGSRAGEGRRTRFAAAAPVQMRLEPVARDTSAAALFGTAPLLARGARAREPAASVWAKGMERAEASRADMLRVAGEYALFTPPRPQGSGVKFTASTAEWALGMNHSISMRRRAAGIEVIRSYLG